MKGLKMLAALLSCPVLLFPGSPENAAAVLKKVDAFRNPLENFSLDLELTSIRKDASEVSHFRVYGQAGDKSLVEFVAPASEKGKYLLMLREAMWIYLPNTSRPVRISPLQRLMGEASNGDVARTNYSVDYEVRQTGEEQVDGHTALVLELAAKDQDLSYTRVKLWAAKETCLPIQAEYYVASGKLMKRVYFREFGNLNGTRMATVVEIDDAVRPDRRTLMRYSNLQPKRLPEKMFNQAYLGRW